MGRRLRWRDTHGDGVRYHAELAFEVDVVALARQVARETEAIVVDVSGMGQLLGTDVSVPVAAKYDTHPITDRFNLLTAYPLVRSVTSVEGGVNAGVASPTGVSPAASAENKR